MRELNKLATSYHNTLLKIFSSRTCIIASGAQEFFFLQYTQLMCLSLILHVNFTDKFYKSYTHLRVFDVNCVQCSRFMRMLGTRNAAILPVSSV